MGYGGTIEHVYIYIYLYVYINIYFLYIYIYIYIFIKQNAESKTNLKGENIEDVQYTFYCCMYAFNTCRQIQRASHSPARMKIDVEKLTKVDQKKSLEKCAKDLP